MRYPFRLFCVIPGILDKKYHVHDIYKESVVRLCKIAEQYGFTGGLIHYNHHVLNPWIIATSIIENTQHFIPLIALQPNSMPPFTAAKMIESITTIYEREISLNLITGAVTEELNQVGDYINHEDRYIRLGEYAEIIKRLLNVNNSVTFNGKFYNLNEVTLKPGLSSNRFRPTMYLAGSSQAGLKVASKVADVVVNHPGPINEFREVIKKNQDLGIIQTGIRVGIIARPTRLEAWNVARAKFPKTRQGAIKTIMKKQSESHWIRRLAEDSEKNLIGSTYWLGAFRNGTSYCPYIVGSYTEVKEYLAQYLALGVTDILLDGIYEESEFIHLDKVLKSLYEHTYKY